MDISGKLNKSVTGTNQDDFISIHGKANAWGRGGDDQIWGSSAANKIYGENGDDVIHNMGGNDVVDGGRGNDGIYNIEWIGAQYEHFHGGNVKFYGGSGNDWLLGGLGNDFLDGGDGNDVLSGVSGKDTLRGGAGNDHFDHRGNPGATYSGGAGHDTLRFEEYDRSPYDPDNYYNFPSTVDDNKPWLDVRVTGEAKGEFGISSGPGAGDYIREGTFTGMNAFSAEGDIHQLFYKGGNSDNTVIGSYNNDFLVGGEGNETFAGSYGDDAFLFEFNPNGMGHDQVLDYTNIDPLEPPYGGMGLDFIGLVGTSGYNVRTETIDFGNSKIFQTYNVTPTGEYVVHTLNVYGDINNLTMGNIPDIWF